MKDETYLCVALHRALVESAVALGEHDHDDADGPCDACTTADEIRAELDVVRRRLLNSVERVRAISVRHQNDAAWVDVEVYCGEVIENDVALWREAHGGDGQ